MDTYFLGLYSRHSGLKRCFVFPTFKTKPVGANKFKTNLFKINAIHLTVCLAKPEKNNHLPNSMGKAENEKHVAFDFKKQTRALFTSLPLKDQKDILKTAFEAGRTGNIGDYQRAFYKTLVAKIRKSKPKKKNTMTKARDFVLTLSLPWAIFFWSALLSVLYGLLQNLFPPSASAMDMTYPSTANVGVSHPLNEESIGGEEYDAIIDCLQNSDGETQKRENEVLQHHSQHEFFKRSYASMSQYDREESGLTKRARSAPPFDKQNVRDAAGEGKTETGLKRRRSTNDIALSLHTTDFESPLKKANKAPVRKPAGFSFKEATFSNAQASQTSTSGQTTNQAFPTGLPT